jgi:hypothetical protein
MDMMHRVNIVGAKPYSAPCTSDKWLTASDGDPLPDPSLYRHMIGALQFAHLLGWTLPSPSIIFVNFYTVLRLPT